jgi:hypothetical protein
MSSNGFWNGIGQIFQEFFKRYFSGILEGYGIVGIPAVIIAIGLSYSFWKALSTVVKPTPDVSWNRLNPDDRAAMEKSFSDLRILMALAKKIDGNTAESVDEFTAQIRSLKQFGVP